MNPRISLSHDAIAAFCRKWQIVEFALFGSVLRDDFRPDSDLDVLVRFEDGLCWDFGHLREMTKELEDLCGRKIDLVEKPLIERSENYIRRKHILSHMERIYVAR